MPEKQYKKNIGIKVNLCNTLAFLAFLLEQHIKVSLTLCFAVSALVAGL